MTYLYVNNYTPFQLSLLCC